MAELEFELADKSFVISLGEQQLLNDGRSLGLSYFPDQTSIVLARSPELRVLAATGQTTYLLSGEDWSSLNHAQAVLAPRTGSAYDNGYVGIAGVFNTSPQRIYAIYHAEDHVDIPRFSSGAPGYYASVAMASSTDSGETWQRLGPVITSPKGKSWQKHPGQADRGTGEPSLVVDKTGEWVYVYYTEHSRIDSTGVHIGMARAPIDFPPESVPSFHKLSNGSFDQPGVGGMDTPVISLPDPSVAESMIPHVTYVPALDAYLMVLSVNYWDDYLTGRGLTDSGVYLATSMDGVNWSTPELLFRDYTVPVVGRSFTWGATLIPDGDKAQSGWMVYGHSPNWGAVADGRIPHRLAGRRFQIVEQQ